MRLFTPRMLVAHAELIDRRRMREKADFVEAVQWGMHGDPKVLKRLLRKMRELL